MRRGAMRVPVVEIGTRLAADGERVFKSGGGDEGDAGAFAFEQGVGRDGGAVADFQLIGAGLRWRCVAHGFENGAARILGRGTQLEDFDAFRRRGRRSR